MAKRIGILTAGGDAPGLNVCLKALVYNAVDRGYEVIGIRKGWEGLLDPEVLAALLVEDKKSNPNNYAILTMSEASRIAPEKASKYTPELSRWARPSRLAEATAAKAQELGMKTGKRVSGSGAMVTEILEHLTGQRLIFQPLSLLIRTAVPDGQDLLGAINFAMMAVNLLAAGKTGRLAAYRHHDNYIDLPMETVTEPGGNINVAEHYDATRFYPKPTIMWAARI